MPKETFFNLPEDKRGQILEILLEEFAENDYKSVSVSQIVARAGIAKGSFYQYFEDKQDCYLYLLQLAMDEKTAFLNQVPSPEEDGDPFNYLRRLLDVGVRFEFSNPRLARIAYRAVFDDAPLPDETQALIRKGGMQYFQQFVQQGVEAGYIKADIDTRLAAFIHNAIFNNLGVYLLERFEIEPGQLLGEGPRSLNRDAVRDLLDQAVAILEHGLRRDTTLETEKETA